jgi:hypothetical protein
MSERTGRAAGWTPVRSAVQVAVAFLAIARWAVRNGCAFLASAHSIAGARLSFPSDSSSSRSAATTPNLDVAALVCKLPEVLAHILSVDRPSRPIEDAHSVEELILVDHHAPGR